MKRKIDQISNEAANAIGDENREQPIIFGNDFKRLKLETQRVGDFIVDAKQAFNFKLGIFGITNLMQIDSERS